MRNKMPIGAHQQWVRRMFIQSTGKKDRGNYLEILETCQERNFLNLL